MPGYSGTSLPKKLGVKEGFRVALIELPPEVKAELRAALSKCTMAKDGRGPLDFAMMFVTKQTELKKQFARAAEELAPAGMLWVSWPKKASGVATDITEDTIREVALPLGLVDIKVCAVDDVWSGLKFVIPKAAR